MLKEFYDFLKESICKSEKRKLENYQNEKPWVYAKSAKKSNL